MDSILKWVVLAATVLMNVLVIVFQEHTPGGKGHENNDQPDLNSADNKILETIDRRVKVVAFMKGFRIKNHKKNGDQGKHRVIENDGKSQTVIPAFPEPFRPQQRINHKFTPPAPE